MRILNSTFAKVTMGFIAGALAVGGVATAAGTFSGNVVSACADNRTGALYASSTGVCGGSRTAVSLGTTTSIKGIVQQVSPSVVTVNVDTAQGGDTGSGSIIKSIDSVSYIATNNHVIDAAVGGGGSITVEFDNGDTLPATIVGRDSNYDLAVLKVNKGNLPVIQIGSSSSLNIGDQLIAFGSPLGLDHTVTSGIVSSLNRPVTTGTTGAESYVDAIQTDAAINPGNSGGPLTDGLGRMVGINSAIASLGASSPFGGSQAGSIGLGFAIPIDEAKRIFDEIIKNGYSTRPILGVYFDPNYTGKGAKILKLTTSTPPDPAQAAGIPAGAVITAIDGKSIADQTTAIVRIRSYAPGTKVSITVTMPSGGSRTFNVTLGSARSN